MAKKNIEITGIIPVKANSERVKKKNLRKFGNTNLYELKLKQLERTKNFKSFIVSSEDENILKVAKKFGFEIHKRDPYYSTNTVPMSEVYKYIGKSVNAEHIAWINVTNPLAETYIYDKAVEIYKKNFGRYDCLLSAIENRENFFYKKKPINFKRSPWPRSQDLEPLISLPFVINIMKKKNLINWGSCVGKKPYFYILDTLQAKDIDNPVDFLFCQEIFKKKLHKN